MLPDFLRGELKFVNINIPPSFTSENYLFKIDFSGNFQRMKKWKYYYFISRENSKTLLPYARNLLWTVWKNNGMNSVLSMLMDEYLLRNYQPFYKFWRYFNIGRIDKSSRYLENNVLTLGPSLQISTAIRSQFCYKYSDLFKGLSGGQSHKIFIDEKNNGDLSRMFSKTIEQGNPKKILEVTACDSGTFPSDGGGVQSCRRDLVDRLEGIYWSCISEVGNSSKLINVQVQKNVNSLSLVPLWGAELGGARQVLSDMLIEKSFSLVRNTTSEVIKKLFCPLIRDLIIACDTAPLITDIQLENATTLLINLHSYFEKFDYSTSWSSPYPLYIWRNTWMQIYSKKKKLTSDEMPTIADLDSTYGLFMHFLMFLISPINPQCKVTHASHTGVQALIGVIAKRKYGASFILWSHGVLFRERIKGLGEFKTFSLFTRNSLIALTRYAVDLNMYHVTYISSCTRIGNPDWHRHLNKRSSTAASWLESKMTPVTNGMETNRFYVDHKKQEEKPTALMLSHVYDLKNVKLAIQSAAIVVHGFKLSDYTLLVYGSLNKDAVYVNECREMISSLDLEKNVYLLGPGPAAEIIGRGWIFLNSSKSEGLPLALGEAGLAGLPVVCTDVGGSRQVLEDLDNNIIYGSIVPPGNPLIMAKEIIGVLGMLDGRDGKVCLEGEEKPTPVTLNELTSIEDLKTRIMSKTVQTYRWRLGIMFRAYVLRTFSMDRYLREHLYLIRVGAHRSDERRTVLKKIKDKKVFFPSGTNRHIFYVGKQILDRDQDIRNLEKSLEVMIHNEGHVHSKQVWDVKNELKKLRMSEAALLLFGDFMEEDGIDPANILVLMKELKYLKQENARLRNRIQQLSTNNRGTLERFFSRGNIEISQSSNSSLNIRRVLSPNVFSESSGSSKLDILTPKFYNREALTPNSRRLQDISNISSPLKQSRNFSFSFVHNKDKGKDKDKK